MFPKEQPPLPKIYKFFLQKTDPKGSPGSPGITEGFPKGFPSPFLDNETA